MEDSIPLISGSLKQNKISLQWEVEKPITKNIISGFISDNGFSGFFVNYYDKNRNFLYNDSQRFSSTSYSIDNKDLIENFNSIVGQNNLIDLNEFFIDVVSVAKAGLRSTGIALINFTSSTVSVSSISVENTASLSLNYSDQDSLKNVQVFVKNDSVFNLEDQFQDYLYLNSSSFPVDDQIVIPDLYGSTDGAYDNVIRSPYYVHLLPSNYLETGALFTSSGIKTSCMDLPKVQNTTGYV